jgi:hypothetical protein
MTLKSVTAAVCVAACCSGPGVALAQPAIDSAITRFARPDMGPLSAPRDQALDMLGILRAYSPVPEARDLTARDTLPVRHRVNPGGLRTNLQNLSRQAGYDLIFPDLPTCIDWAITGSYVVQGVDFADALDRMLDGYPLKAVVHRPDRTVSITSTAPMQTRREC